MVHGHPMAALWDMLNKSGRLGQRRAECTAFNAANRWVKRGLSVSPGKYGLIRGPGMPARVDIFHDGSIQIAVSGSEIGQGLHTKVAQVAASTLAQGLGVSVSLSSISFTDFSTDVLPHHKMTGGSTTSELACIAAEAACNRLVKSLKAMKAVQKATKALPPGATLTWPLITKAAFDGGPGLAGFLHVCDLTEKGVALPAFSDIMYDVYGAALAEVEVDTLTGESRVLSVVLVMDSGLALDLCVREPIIDPICVREPIIDPISRVLSFGPVMDLVLDVCVRAPIIDTNHPA
jgi:xanthine dehydrogenase/oxidase